MDDSDAFRPHRDVPLPPFPSSGEALTHVGRAPHGESTGDDHGDRKEHRHKNQEPGVVTDEQPVEPVGQRLRRPAQSSGGLNGEGTDRGQRLRAFRIIGFLSNGEPTTPSAPISERIDRSRRDQYPQSFQGVSQVRWSPAVPRAPRRGGEARAHRLAP